MKTIRTILLGLGFGLLASGAGLGCSDSNNPPPPPGNMDGGTFSQFVTDLIVNQTREDNEPVDVDNSTTANLADDENETAYDSLFQ